jgi:hypothetical protein
MSENTDPAGDPQAGNGTDDDAPLGDAGKRALESERRMRREAEQRARAAEGRIAELEAAEAKRQHEATIAELRAEVAAEKNLSPSQARRLSGSTREELLADADDLLDAFGATARSGPPSSRPVANMRGGNDPTEDPTPDADTLADRILNRGL